MEPLGRWARQIGDYTDQVRGYEARVALYEQAGSNRFDDDVKIAALATNAPEVVKAHLRLMVDGSTKYTTFRGALTACEVATKLWAVSTTWCEQRFWPQAGPVPAEVAPQVQEDAGQQVDEDLRGGAVVDCPPIEAPTVLAAWSRVAAMRQVAAG